MIERTLFQPDHQAFVDSFRRFIDKEVTPHHAAWEDQGYVAREVWSQAGANGFLCMSLPEEYGGAGADKLKEGTFQVSNSVSKLKKLRRADKDKAVAELKDNLREVDSTTAELVWNPAVGAGLWATMQHDT